MTSRRYNRLKGVKTITRCVQLPEDLWLLLCKVADDHESYPSHILRHILADWAIHFKSASGSPELGRDKLQEKEKQVQSQLSLFDMAGFDSDNDPMNSFIDEGGDSGETNSD